MTGQVTGFDITWPTSLEKDAANVAAALQEHCSKWVFQMEEYPTRPGTFHWQVRLRLSAKLRLQTLISKQWFQGNITITSGTVHKTNDFNYVMDEAKRVPGTPVYSDKDYVTPPPLTRQLREFMQHELYPWQEQVLEMVQQVDDRSIQVIYDTFGNAGKSVFCEWLEYQQLAAEIPPLRSMQDIMGVVMSIGAKRAFMCDMPRGMKKDKLAEFYSGLECLKNGKAYDIRYKYRSLRFDRPQVIVFTNTLPVLSLMTPDRWVVWDMQLNHTLIPHAFD